MVAGAPGRLALAGALLTVLATGLAFLPRQVLADDVVTTRAHVDAAVTAAIDIEPGSNPNSVNLGCQGTIPVALITTPDFNAAAADPPTMTFAGASPARWAMEDVGGDGDLDLVLHFNCREVRIPRNATALCLHGETYGDISIDGCDSVRIVSESRPKGRCGGAGGAPAVTPAVLAGATSAPTASESLSADATAHEVSAAAPGAGGAAFAPISIGAEPPNAAAAAPAEPTEDSQRRLLPPSDAEAEEWDQSWPWLLPLLGVGLALSPAFGLILFRRRRP